MKLSYFARFTTRGLPDGSIEITCTRCETPGTVGPRARYGSDELLMSHQVAWALDHVCPVAVTALPRRELAAV